MILSSWDAQRTWCFTCAADCVQVPRDPEWMVSTLWTGTLQTTHVSCAETWLMHVWIVDWDCVHCARCCLECEFCAELNENTRCGCAAFFTSWANAFLTFRHSILHEWLLVRRSWVAIAPFKNRSCKSSLEKGVSTDTQINRFKN